MEMEEAQLRLSPRTCLTFRSREKNYRVLSVVLFNTQKDCHTVHKFLQEVQIGQDLVQSNSSLFKLQENIKKSIGLHEYCTIVCLRIFNLIGR